MNLVLLALGSYLPLLDDLGLYKLRIVQFYFVNYHYQLFDFVVDYFVSCYYLVNYSPLNFLDYFVKTVAMNYFDLI